MYDKEQEKAKVLGVLKEASQDEIKFTKDQNFFRAIDFALGEVDELNQEFNRFMDRVQHLEVFQESVKDPLVKDMSKLMETLRYLIEKNYTPEDKVKMPKDVLDQVKATQDRRINLLKRVARKYFHRPKPN